MNAIDDMPKGLTMTTPTTTQDYDLVPVTAGERWWEWKPSEVLLHGQDVLAIVVAPYRAGRYHVMCADSADNPHVITLDVNGFGITRRVPRQREGWRYFMEKGKPTNRRRANEDYRQTHCIDSQTSEWDPMHGIGCSASGYAIDPNWIETDSSGNPLQTPAAPPTRTPLSAESFPMWAVWVRRTNAWTAIRCRRIQAVTETGIIVDGCTNPVFKELADANYDYQIAGTNGVWHDATVEGVRDAK